MARIIAGPFAGHEGELIADLGDTLELEIVSFGHQTTVRVQRVDVDLDGGDRGVGCDQDSAAAPAHEPREVEPALAVGDPATLERSYASWRDERWSVDDHRRKRAAAERELARLRPAFAETLDAVWGFELPESLVRFWLFLRVLQPAELAVLDRLELAPFGIMDVFARPDAEAMPGLDPRLHGRFYCDPPEMLSFMHGGGEGLHYGLWFDDGRRASGVVSSDGSDDGGLGRPRGTPLEVVRARLELACATDELGARERLFERRLLREAIVRFETGERVEQGAAYDSVHEAPARAAADAESDPERLHTIDEAGALVRGEPVLPRGHSMPGSDDERAVVAEWIDCIRADDPAVDGWIAEARRRLDAGDPAAALALGRDLHWLSGGEDQRERQACELLSAAYRALGRESLAAIAELHCRHRNRPSVDVLLRR